MVSAGKRRERWRFERIAAGLAAAIVMAPAFAWAEVPALSSAPEAHQVIFLDFDGHFEPRSPHRCPPPVGSVEGWSIDVATSDISRDIDAGAVRRIWQAVAEDFAPFFVDVTTDPKREPDPDTDTGAAIRVAIGVSSLADGALGASPAGCAVEGAYDPAYLNPRIANVAVVHLDPWRPFNARAIAARISHEAGHLYGLSHHLAAPAALDDWIVAPQGSAPLRYVWRKGQNEFGRQQDDLDELSLLLERRPDGAEPKNLRTYVGLSGRRLYGHGTLQEAGDVDDFAFEVIGTGRVTFEVFAGVWLDPATTRPEHGLEANFRPVFQIVDPVSQAVLACPEGLRVTLTSARYRIIDADCALRPQNVQPGGIYRIRIDRHATSQLDGNLGRYTILVRGPVAALTWPPRIDS
jgi:hypothetical protein